MYCTTSDYFANAMQYYTAMTLCPPENINLVESSVNRQIKTPITVIYTVYIIIMEL